MKLYSFRFLSILPILIISSISKAESWQKISIPIHEKYTQEIYLSKKFKKISNKKFEINYKEYIGFVGSYELFKVQIDCKNRSVIDHGGRIFDKNGIATKFTIAPKPTINLKSDTVYRYIFNEVC